MLRLHILLASLLAAPFAAQASDPQQPEIRRPAAAAQAVGALHSLRTVPEACTRLEGLFTGDAARPYKLAAVRTSERCQARAKFVDAATAKPSGANGWLLNDLIRVPASSCQSQQAVVRIWRKDAKVAPPVLDAQGRSRIYLKDSMDAARAGDLKPVPVYAAVLSMEGTACR
ncbi:MAG: hypothetical protein EOP93_18645 [Lysobacteraceae bacterium]|nr:MAG: hypothetical protein EOP93_18645 [Xanthomonadaceae bacterium]